MGMRGCHIFAEKRMCCEPGDNPTKCVRHQREMWDFTDSRDVY